jgi:RNA polymerase sigma factor (sigma-70 family)
VNPRFHPHATVARPLRRSPSDARLVELARGGSEPAFEAIVARYRLPLVRHCARLVGEADAEDAAQDALVSAHAALLRGAAVRQLAPWLYAIAQNAARSCLRARAARPGTADAACDRGVLAHGSAEGRQELRDVLAAVSSLPDRQRDAIVMRELEGRSYDEIASRLGASPGAVRQLLNRARGSVRDRIRVLVPVEPFVRWALSRSSGANAAGGATLSGACVLGAKVCVVALLPATVALVPSLPTPRHTTVTRGARPATKRIHVGVATTRSAAARRATSATLAVRLISSRASTHTLPLVAGERLGGRANPPARVRPSRRASSATGHRSRQHTAAIHPTQPRLTQANPPGSPANPQPPAASSDPHTSRTLSSEHPPVIASREYAAVGPGPTHPTSGSGQTHSTGAPGPKHPGQGPSASHSTGAPGPAQPTGASGPSHGGRADGPGGTHLTGAAGPTHATGASGPGHGERAEGPGGTHLTGAAGPTHATGASGPSDGGRAWGPAGTHATGASGPTHSAEVGGTTQPAGVGGPTHPAGVGGPTHPTGASARQPPM